MRKTFTHIGLLAAVVLTFSLMGSPAEAATPSLKRLAPSVKMEVKVKSGAPVFNRKGKVIRKKGKVVRLRYKGVQVYTHYVRIKGKQYRKPLGKKYLVRTSTLRTAPPVRTPKPVQPTPETEPIIKGKTLVFGDSISVPDYAWWATVRDRTKSEFSVSAIGGTGMLNSGAWGGGTFGSRLHYVDEVKPDFIIIAGGRNDWGYANGERPTPEVQRATILNFMSELKDAATRNKIHAQHVFIMNIWGTDSRELRDPIVAAMNEGAYAQGFEFVDMPMLESAQLPVDDGTHPHAEGHVWIADQFLAKSNYKAKLANLNN